MARRRSDFSAAGPNLLVSVEAEYREIEGWYRELLRRTPPPSWLTEPEGPDRPVALGPTWKWDPRTGWVLPEHTIGWRYLAWTGMWLRGVGGEPWTFTPEQARAELWFYAHDGGGRIGAPTWVIQRLKGWGKDPLAAVKALAHMCGPVNPVDDAHGDVVGEPHEDAWIQLCAVSQEQTETTTALLPGLVSEEMRDQYGVIVGAEVTYALNRTRRIQAITSNPLTVEGKRPTLVVQNETQNWRRNNAGHAMDAAIDGNLAKSPADRQARRLYICNAYQQGADSVAQRVREGWERTQGPDATMRPTGLVYDSLEAPESAPLTVESAPRVIEQVRGDATWLDPDRVVLSISDPKNPPSESRRKWYNTSVSAEDSWVTKGEWDKCGDTARKLDPSDEIAVFFDGGKSDDATALVGCRVTDGLVVTLGMWQRPPQRRAGTWVAPRDVVDATVRSLVETHNVVALWADPSHARDDETQAGYWDDVIDGWHRDLGPGLRYWAKGGRGSKSRSREANACVFDMSDPVNLKRFVPEVGRVYQEIAAGELVHDGDRRLRLHVLNAKRMPSRYGLSIGKDHRESQRKIDLAVAMVGARMIRRAIRNDPNRRRTASRGSVW